MSGFAPGAGTRPVLLGRIATVVLDGRGRVVRWSRAAAELVGMEAGEVLGKPVGGLLVGIGERRRPVVTGGAVIPRSGTATVRRGSGGARGTGDLMEIGFLVTPLDAAHRLVLAAPAHHLDDWEQGASLLRGLLAQDRIGIEFFDEDLRLVRTNMAGTRRGTAPPADDSVPEAGDGRSPPAASFAVRLEDDEGHPAGVAALRAHSTGRRRAEDHRGVLYDASYRIGRSLDVNRAAQDVVDVLVPALGDLAAVNLAEAVFDGEEPARRTGGGALHLRRAAQASATGSWPAALLQDGETLPPVPYTAALRSLQHGGAVIATRAMAEAMYPDPELLRLLVPDRGHSVLWAPLSARGLLLGVITLWRTDWHEPFEPDDAYLMTEVASRAALSIDNARRYTREHREAVTLQQSLLPRAVTDVPAASTMGFYLPADGDANVSGDWFDVLALPSLRAALVVGDVFGHGLKAAATMGQLRTAIQTLTDVELDPEELLTRLDDTVRRLAAEAGGDDTVGATCLYALYDPVTRRCVLASAGHPPPLLLRADGSCRQVELSPGPPLGVGGIPFESTTITLDPDSVLALYTDGLIEHGGRDPEAGTQGLIDVLAERWPSTHSLEAVGRSVLAGLDASAPRDDITLLLARTRVVAEDATAAWEFPADPAVVAHARAAVTQQLAGWGLDEMVFATEIVVSELVTNAVRYAGGPIGLRVIRDAAVLICEVTDPSNTQPRLRRALTTDEGGRGLFLVAQLAQRWGSRYGPSGKTIWAEQRIEADTAA